MTKDTCIAELRILLEIMREPHLLPHHEQAINNRRILELSDLLAGVHS